MHYYAIKDLQTGDYMHTARNETNLTELEKSFRDFVIDGEDIAPDTPFSEILIIYEFEVHKFESKIDENKDCIDPTIEYEVVVFNN